MGSPKIDENASLIPTAPPPPAAIAEELKTPELAKRKNSRKRGVSGLIAKRPSVNIGATTNSLNI